MRDLKFYLMNMKNKDLLRIFKQIKFPKKYKVSALVLILITVLFGFLFDSQLDPNDYFIVDQNKTENQINNDNLNLGENIFQVSKVIDGDTIKVYTGNSNQEQKTIRLISINTPEIHNPTKSIECFGEEAYQKALSLLDNQKVRLEYDFKKGELDKYGRTLAYVFLERDDSGEEIFINEFMIREGYAYEESYGVGYKYQDLFERAQIDAEKKQRGLWDKNICIE